MSQLHAHTQRRNGHHMATKTTDDENNEEQASSGKAKAKAVEVAEPADYPLVSTADAGYTPTLELAVVSGLLVQAHAAPHDGQTPAKVWVPIPGQRAAADKSAKQ